MAATGKTPILLYGSTTATNQPSAGNLTNSSDGCEIAINVADKNLFFKDSTNVVNTVPIRQSGASSNGWLSSTDWTTFNGKQAALGYTPVNKAGDTMSGSLTAPSFIPSSSTTPTNGLYLLGANNPAIAVNSARAVSFTSLGAGFNVDSPINVSPYEISTEVRGALLGSTYSSANGGGYGLVVGKMTGNSYAGYVEIGSYTNNPVVFVENNAEVGRWSNGNLVISTSGKGIDFSATPGTGTSELLADYEEGTFTATLAGGTTNPSTPVTKTAYYTKIGDMVSVYINFNNVNTTGASGQVQVTGLPYTASSSVASSGTIWINQASTTGVITIEAGATSLDMLSFTGSSANWSGVGAGCYTRMQITYKSA